MGRPKPKKEREREEEGRAHANPIGSAIVRSRANDFPAEEVARGAMLFWVAPLGCSFGLLFCTAKERDESTGAFAFLRGEFARKRKRSRLALVVSFGFGC